MPDRHRYGHLTLATAIGLRRDPERLRSIQENQPNGARRMDAQMPAKTRKGEADIVGR